MSGELYDLALSIPWCITDEALEAMLSIAARDPLPEDEIARRMHGPKSLALRQGQRHEDSRTIRVRNGVATLLIDGPIYRYADLFTRMSGGVTTEALARDLGTALDDPAIGAILLMIDSPGGEATGINELADTIYAARGRKPIVAYIEGYGASAAYWIASAADLVVADDTALIGSIGTVMGVPDPAKRISRTINFVSTQSPKKRANPTTDDGRAYLQSLVDDMTDVFIAKVARNRRLDAEQVAAIEGAMLVGQKAVDAGLADMLGSEEQVLAALAMGARPVAPRRNEASRQIDARTSVQLQEEPMPSEKKGFWAWINGEPGTAAAPEQPATAVIQAAAAPLMQVAAEPLQPVQQKAETDLELTRLRAELTRLRAEQIQKDAHAFAAAELSASRAYPAEQAAMAALYVRAAEQDAAHPRDDGQPSCVALLKAAYTSRPAHQLSKHLLPANQQAVVLTNNADSDAAELDRAEASAREYAKRANGKRAQ